MLREFSYNHPDTESLPEINRLEALLPQVEQAAELSSLLGLEGAGARAYFAAFARMVRHTFGFIGRRRHPAPDPVNALLSLGYTMVYNEIASLLDGLGFDPYLGFFHQPDYGHATLASDLLEEFRAPLVDRLTLSLINNRVFTAEDFFVHEPSRGAYLQDEPRKRYFQEYERFVGRAFTALDENQETDFRHLFRRQAERLRKALLTTESYRPFKFCWR